jgi:hypothetical protein
VLLAAALAELVLGAGLFLLGRWGRLSADRLVPSHIASAERLRRADALARSALFCQGIGLVLGLFSVLTGVIVLT